MTNEQEQVRDFMVVCGQDCPDHPLSLDRSMAVFRTSLIEEELTELRDAFFVKDLVNVADALADLMYVVLGTACACGIDLEPVFAEVHRSNMSKMTYTPGSLVPTVIKNHQGKILKPPTYTPPVLQPILLAQILKK